jgi:hypothetical protein
VRDLAGVAAQAAMGLAAEDQPGAQAVAHVDVDEAPGPGTQAAPVLPERGRGRVVVHDHAHAERGRELVAQREVVPALEGHRAEQGSGVQVERPGRADAGTQHPLVADAGGVHEGAGRAGDAPDDGARVLARRDHEVVERPDLAREVDHGDHGVGPIELDPDGVGRLVVDAQAPLGAAAVVAHGVLDQRIGRQQATDDVGDRLQGEAGRLGDRWPGEAAVRAHEAEDDDLVVVLDAGEVGAGHRRLDLDDGPFGWHDPRPISPREAFSHIVLVRLRTLWVN